MEAPQFNFFSTSFAAHEFERKTVLVPPNGFYNECSLTNRAKLNIELYVVYSCWRVGGGLGVIQTEKGRGVKKKPPPPPNLAFFTLGPWPPPKGF